MHRLKQSLYPLCLPGLSVTALLLGHHGGTYFERVAFLDAIEGRPTNAATVLEGFWAVVIGLAAEQSVHTGCPVNIAELLGQLGILNFCSPACESYNASPSRLFLLLVLP